MSTAPIARPFDPAWFERQLLVRGWGLSELCERARLSPGTASHARNGNRVSLATIQKIAAAFQTYPPDPAFDSVAEGLR